MAIKDFASELRDVITVEPYRRGDSYTEDAPFGEPIAMKAKIMGATRLFFDADGRQVASTQKIILGKKLDIQMRDRVTLIGRDPANPVIVGIEKVSDDRGWSHTVLYLS